MKNKKCLVSVIILVVAVLMIAVYAVVSGIALKPAVTEAAFPFSITYELDGQTVTIDEVYNARYVRNDGYADSKSRVYAGEIENWGEDNSVYTLKKDGNGRIELYTHFYADYMMGDAQYDYFDDEAFEPRIYFYDSEENEYDDEETLSALGVKLVSFEYPEPIENSLVFSHISRMSGEVVIPTLLIALLALVAMLIFVRRDKDLKYNVVAIISLVLNCIIGSVYLAFVTIVAILIDIGGSGPELYYQVLYLIPSFSVLCIAASVALRRKGYGVQSLIAQLIGPGIFVVYLIVCGVLGLL